MSELSVKFKDRAVLLYKFFKVYFVEHEKKWLDILNTMKDKIRYFKDLCKIMIQQKHKHIQKVERINDVLFANNLTRQNLEDHKQLIKDLLLINNEKREEIYIMTSNQETFEKEMRFWIYDFDCIKLSESLRVMF